MTDLNDLTNRVVDAVGRLERDDDDLIAALRGLDDESLDALRERLVDAYRDAYRDAIEAAAAEGVTITDEFTEPGEPIKVALIGSTATFAPTARYGFLGLVDVPTRELVESVDPIGDLADAAAAEALDRLARSVGGDQVEGHPDDPYDLVLYLPL